jgi:hypothetical protein
MSLAVAAPAGALWKDSSLDSAQTKPCIQPLQLPGVMMQQQRQLSAQPSAAATLEGGLIWQGSSRQMAADNFMLPGQPQMQQQQQQLLQQPQGMPGFATPAGSKVAAAGTGTAGCCPIAATLSDELGSDEADFAMYGLTPAAAAPYGSAHGVAAGAEQQQQGAAGESEPVAIKQFTASSKKQLTSKFRWARLVTPYMHTSVLLFRLQCRTSNHQMASWSPASTCFTLNNISVQVGQG